ncbi:hypothetical protein [Stenotrophomonas sp.]|uniref:hypothetical protein n=1 Tax=Stenotrophomonas sp. TaxID=69392 RepID=UPI0028AF5213|nr:hypothetical protein [Stenotrophomonas sp.]
MNYPLDAFRRVDMREVAPGTLATSQGMWLLKLENDGHGTPQMMILAGNDAGSVSNAAGPAFAVSGEYSWGVYFDSLDFDRNHEARPAVSIGADGVIIHGHAWRERMFEKPVNTAGARVATDPATYYCRSFSIWLTGRDGNRLGDTALLSV